MIPLTAPVLIAWYAVKSVVYTAVAGFRALPGPIQALIFGGVMGVAGIAYGSHVEAARCQARIAASIHDAREADASIEADAKSNADRQRVEADARTVAVREEVKGYVDELSKRTAAACTVGLDADRYNDGLGVRDDEVQPSRQEPSAGGGHRPEPGAVPARKGKR